MFSGSCRLRLRPQTIGPSCQKVVSKSYRDQNDTPSYARRRIDIDFEIAFDNRSQRRFPKRTDAESQAPSDNQPSEAVCAALL